MAKKVLISGYIGFDNFGDDIIFSVLVSYLKEKGAIITALSNTPNETSKKYQINSYKFSDIKAIFQTLLSTDILFSGGGSLLQNNTSNKSLIYYLGIILLAKFFGKKVVIFAQGMEGIHGKFLSFIAKNILKMCDIVTVRDVVSKNIMDSWNIKSELVPDPINDIKLPEYKPNNQVGIQLRENDILTTDFMDKLVASVGEYYKGKKIKIFPFQEKLDKKVCEDFEKKLKASYKDLDIELVSDLDTDNIIKYFSNLDYLIAMRFHACLLGFMYGIKTLPIVYDDKVLNIVKDANLPYVKSKSDTDFIQKFKNIEENQEQKKIDFPWHLFDNYVIGEEV